MKGGGGGGGEESNQGFDFFPTGALTRESDFPGECLNNFANACSTMENSEENVHGDIVVQKVRSADNKFKFVDCGCSCRIKLQ